MGTHLIKGLNPLLQYVADLMSVFQIKPIAEPQKYRDKVLAAKDVLKHDISGLVNSTIDFGMAAVSGVNYQVSTEDASLTKLLNEWLDNINEGLRGHVPTGVGPLAKEYCRERWKGSSQLLLRAFWENVDGYQLPNTMFFVDGEDIVCKNAEDPTITLGEEKYAIRVSNDKKDDIPLPRNKQETIYLQMPYEHWGTRETKPYLIRRGIWHNLVFMQLLSEKGEFVVARALEYLFLIKKGTENMYLDGNISYSREDLEKVSKDFQELLAKKKYEIPVINGLPTGAPTYATQFDTTMEHLIPDYSKIISQELFAVIERRLLAGLGLIDLLEGTSGSKAKQSKLNAAPFMSEVRQAVTDFKCLLHDIMKEIAIKNNKKWKSVKINITASPITDFVSEDGKTLLRSLYDRGLLSRQTIVTILGETDFETEVARLKDEKKKGIVDVMFPPVITNIDEQIGAKGLPGKSNPTKVKEPGVKNTTKTNDKVPADKMGPEKKNYKNASLEKPEEGEVFELNMPFEKPTMSDDLPPLPSPNFTRDEFDIVNLPAEVISESVYEDAPYKENTGLPPAVQKYPSASQSAFRKAFNNALKFYKDEQTAFRVAWSVLKARNKKDGYVELPEQHGDANNYTESPADRFFRYGEKDAN